MGYLMSDMKPVPETDAFASFDANIKEAAADMEALKRAMDNDRHEWLTLVNRVKALEHENIAIRAKLVELEEYGGRKRVPPPPAPPRPMITEFASPTTAGDLPNVAEMAKLRAICAREYPAFCSSNGFVWARVPDKDADEREWFYQFERAILALSNMRVRR
jgi:hypothetical protein